MFQILTFKSSGLRFFSNWYGSRRSFHQRAKKWRKKLISTILWLITALFSLKTDENVGTLIRNKQRFWGKQKHTYFLLPSCKLLKKSAGSWYGYVPIKTSWIQNTVRNECKGVIWDPDPDKEELDPEKWFWSGFPTLPEEGSPEPHRASRCQTGRSSPPVHKLTLMNKIPYQRGFMNG